MAGALRAALSAALELSDAIDCQEEPRGGTLELNAGYDSPKSSREQDHLERWRIAREILRIIEGTPSDWSVRIAVFGEWGEGKSTVLQFAESLLKERGHLALQFNPWAAQTWDDLWAEFSSQLFDALGNAGIEIDEGAQKAGRAVLKFIEKHEGAAELLASLHDSGKALKNLSYGALRGWLRPDGEQLKKIRQKLGEKRLVVFIDDLDRADPKLVPQLLLSLRELLDRSGFAFVLAFDDKIVAGALKAYHPAWGEGGSFLEKILDFRFHLPAVTPDQRRDLLLEALNDYCPFIPRDSARDIEDLIPSNPRRLKTLVRNISALKGEIERHDADELNWTDIWLAQLMLLESPVFFENLLEADTLETETGLLYEVLHSLDRQSGRTKEEEANKSILERMVSWGIVDQHVQQRLISILEAIRGRGGLHFRYCAELLIKPQRLTGKELNNLVATWEAKRSTADIVRWVDTHAAERGVKQDRMLAEVFEGIRQYRTRVLESAADSDTSAEHEERMKYALLLLEFLRVLLLDLKLLAPHRVRTMLDHGTRWIAFTTNAGDVAARAAERQLLLDLLRAMPPDQAIGYLEAFKPWDPFREDIGTDARGLAPVNALRAECLALVMPSACRVVWESLRIDSTIRSLWDSNRHVATLYTIFSPASPLLTDLSLRAELIRTVSFGATDAIVRRNCIEFLELIGAAYRQEVNWVSSKDAARLLGDKGLVIELWKSATAAGIQYRMQEKFLDMRDLFMKHGCAESDLALTAQLQERLRSLKPKPAPSEAVADVTTDEAAATAPEDNES